MPLWLAEVSDSVFFTNSVSSICVMITKTSRFIEDEDQRLRVVVDLMLREKMVKLLQGGLNIPRVLLFEIFSSCISSWVLPKHQNRLLLHFDPEISKHTGIWRFCKEFPKPCILQFLGLPAVDTQ